MSKKTFSSFPEQQILQEAQIQRNLRAELQLLELLLLMLIILLEQQILHVKMLQHLELLY